MGLPRTVGLRAELCRGLRMRVCSAVCGEECTGACRQEALKTCPVCGRATQRKPFWESGEKENPLCRRAKCKNLWKSLKHLERAVQESARKALVAAVERGEAV
jgi:hypothetical protein